MATFGFGLLLQNLISTFLMFGQVDSVTVYRPKLFGVDARGIEPSISSPWSSPPCAHCSSSASAGAGWVAYYTGLSDSPLALEAHGTDTRLTRLYVFCAAAGIAAVGGVLIAAVTQSARRHAHRTSSATSNSVVLLAVLAFCGSQPLLSPIIAAFIFEVLKIYGPFTASWFENYEGALFGLAAIGVAVVPGVTVSIRGRRHNDRVGRSPVTSRTDPRPVEPTLPNLLPGVTH